MNLVIKEAISAVENLSNFGPMPGRKLEAETLAPRVLESNILQNHEIKVALVELEIAGSMAGAEGSTSS
jgi:hypothetical protein